MGASPLPRRVPWIAGVSVVIGDFPSIAALFLFAAMSALCWFLPTEHTVDSAAGWVVMLPILVIVLGPLMIVHVRRQLVALRCLRFGTVAYAMLRDRTIVPWTRDRFGETYRLHFTFEHGKREYDFTTTTMDGELGLLDPRCQIVFMPGEERRVFLVDMLPGRPRIRDDNSVDPRNHLLGGVAALVFGAAAVAVNVAGALLWLR